MHIIIGLAVGVVWLYFWLKGHWFAAVVATLASSVLLILDTWQGAVGFVVIAALAWTPIGVKHLVTTVDFFGPPRTKPQLDASHPSTQPEELRLYLADEISHG